jgi:formamidopyrimidine-DNA glycosylase
LPELPEVETVVSGLERILPGREILGVALGKTDFIDDPGALEGNLPGCRIAAVRRHGKFIVFELDQNHRSPVEDARRERLLLLIHLGMTGQLVVNAAQSPLPPHTHVKFLLDDGCELRYTDIRRFGRMSLIPESLREKYLGALGVDPLEVTESEFCGRLIERRARIKALLLDQHVFRGLGNIYTDESLWRARVHPARLASNLKSHELGCLYEAVQRVLREAIRLRGSSVSDYVDANGERGEFQLRHRVYQREGKKCFRCGARIGRVNVAGRSSYFCPRCQPAPRQKRSKKRRGVRDFRRALQRQKYISAAPATLNIAP